jgi:hypothetical protein
VLVALTNPNYELGQAIEDLTLYIYTDRNNHKPDTRDETPDNTDGTSENIDEVFSDIATHWAKDSIRFVYENGLFAGVSENNFAPDETMTRGMIVTVLARLSKDDLSKYTQSSFADVDLVEWYGKAAAWAVGAGIISGKENSILDPQGTATRAEVATILMRFIQYSMK